MSNTTRYPAGPFLRELRKSKCKSLSQSELARRLNDALPGETYDRIKVWKTEAGQRQIETPVFEAWVDILCPDVSDAWDVFRKHTGHTARWLNDHLGIGLAVVDRDVAKVA